MHIKVKMNRFFVISMVGMASLLCSCQDSLEERCAKECKSYTEKKCPAPLTTDIVIDSLVFERASHTMHYYYTVSGVADDPARFAKINAAKMMKDEVKNATSIRLYKEAGYSFAYTYWSAKNKGQVLCDVIVTKKDYQ